MRVFEGKSIFDSSAEYLTNTINTVGAMGAGLALEFRLRIPEMYDIYKEKCDRGEIRIGEYWIYDRPNRMGKKVLNFPVKRGFNHPSQWPYIIDGLHYFEEHYRRDGINSIAFPTLGSRLGKLDDEAVLIMMEEELGSLQITIEIYRKYGQDLLTRWVKQQMSQMSIRQISSELHVTQSESERMKIRLAKAYLISDLVVFDRMSVQLVQKLYDFAYERMKDLDLHSYVEANA